MALPQKLTLRDAQDYLKRVENIFREETHKHHEFLKVLSNYKRGKIDAATVYKRVTQLLKYQDPSLLEGFMAFLPKGIIFTNPTLKKLSLKTDPCSSNTPKGRSSVDKESGYIYDGNHRQHSQVKDTYQPKQSVKRKLEQYAPPENNLIKDHFRHNSVRGKGWETTQQQKLPQKFGAHDKPENHAKEKLKGLRDDRLKDSAQEKVAASDQIKRPTSEDIYLRENLSVPVVEEDTCQKRLIWKTIPNKFDNPAHIKLKDPEQKVAEFAELATSSEEEYSDLFLRQDLSIPLEELESTCQQKLPPRLVFQEKIKAPEKLLKKTFF